MSENIQVLKEEVCLPLINDKFNSELSRTVLLLPDMLEENRHCIV